MDQSESFRKSLDELKSKSKLLASAYEAKLTGGSERAKFSMMKSCNYSDFYKEGKHTCPRCAADADKIEQGKLVQGCRMNGDGYGVFTILCANCGMFATHAYDDHD